MTKKRKIGIGIGLVFVILLVVLLSLSGGGQSAYTSAGELPEITIQTKENTFETVLNNWKSSGIEMGKEIIPIYLENEEKVSGYQGYDKIAYPAQQGDVLRGSITVTKAGLYALYAEYYNNGSNTLKNAVSIQIDKESPYEDAEKIFLTQMYQSADYPFRTDRNGNEIVPDTYRVTEWHGEFLHSINQGTYEALLFYLPTGEHEITITMEQGEAYFGELCFKPYDKIPSYEEYKQKWSLESGIKGADGNLIHLLEAERISRKNSTAPRPESTMDIETNPYASNLFLLSTIGGKTWQDNAEALYYDINIEESGFYNLSFKLKQNEKENTYVYRTITIDGKPPFEEAKHLAFAYSQNWNVVTVGTKEQYYPVYLTKGTHTIGIEVDATMFQPIFDRLKEIEEEISDIALNIRKITGNSQDTYRDWDILMYIPNLDTTMYQIADELGEVYELMTDLNCGMTRNEVLTSLKIAERQLRTLADDPDSIPNHMSMLSDGTGSVGQMLGTISETMMEQPLSLDQIYLWQNDAKLPDYEAGWFTKRLESFKYFLHSFSSETEKEDKEEIVLNVWVNRARNYIDLLQNMIDKDFTTKTGIRVELSIMPNEQKIILANTINTQPDVALGLSAYLPYDLAIRGAVSELSQMEGFAETASQLSAGAIAGYMYDGGIYGLPETQDFYVTFYRKDLLEALSIPIPDTWEEVIAILPELQRYGMNYYVPLATTGSFKTFAMTLPFFYQFGSTLYSEDGSNVIINDEAGIRAMQFMTDLFTIYGLPSQVGDFYQSFRNGTLPIGVSNFATYLKVDAAATELAGKWDIAPMPGIRQEDGSIKRSSIGPGASTVIFKKSEYQKEAWEFLQWWLSAKTQEEFGTQLELLYGSEYIWNTANLTAFQKMPFDETHKQIILKQWESLFEVPRTPANYMVERGISNVWNEIVFAGENTRSALDDAVIEMDRELNRKLEEFEYIKDGVLIRNYQIPSTEEVLKLIEQAERKKGENGNEKEKETKAQ